MTGEINLTFQSTESPFEVGRQVAATAVYTNKDLPNLRAASVAKVLTALVTACWSSFLKVPEKTESES